MLRIVLAYSFSFVKLRSRSIIYQVQQLIRYFGSRRLTGEMERGKACSPGLDELHIVSLQTVEVEPGARAGLRGTGGRVELSGLEYSYRAGRTELWGDLCKLHYVLQKTVSFLCCLGRGIPSSSWPSSNQTPLSPLYSTVRRDHNRFHAGVRLLWHGLSGSLSTINHPMLARIPFVFFIFNRPIYHRAFSSSNLSRDAPPT